MKYNIKLNIDDFDIHGFKLHGYAKVFSNLAFEHLKDTGQGIGVLIQDRYAWVLISMKIKIIKRIEEQVDLEGATWYAGQKGPYYRREFEIKNKHCHMIASSYSVLMDMKDRSLYRSRELPFTRLNENLTHLLDLNTSFRDNVLLTEISKRKVLNSHLDVLGHSNHLKYLEFIYDAMTIDEIKEIKNYNTLELYFQKEMLLNDEFTVNKGVIDDKVVYIINNNTNHERAFTLVFRNE